MVGLNVKKKATKVNLMSDLFRLEFQSLPLFILLTYHHNQRVSFLEAKDFQEKGKSMIYDGLQHRNLSN
jgi:hypothetical protein